MKKKSSLNPKEKEKEKEKETSLTVIFGSYWNISH